MRKIESGKDLNKLDSVVYELDQLNALIGFMQVAFAEGPSVTDEAEAAAALWHIYCRQGELLKQIKELYGEARS